MKFLPQSRLSQLAQGMNLLHCAAEACNFSLSKQAPPPPCTKLLPRCDCQLDPEQLDHFL